MITVVDQVSPWLTPSNTFATTTHDQSGAAMIRSGTGKRDDPARDEHRLAAVAICQGARREVGERLGQPERNEERQRRRRRGQPELALREQREDAPLLPDHRADQRVDADQQRELPDIRAEAQPDVRRHGRRVRG